MSFVFPGLTVEEEVRGDAFNYKAAVVVATPDVWSGTLTSLTAGVLTLSGLTDGTTAPIIDGVTVAIGNRVLIKNAEDLSGGAKGYNGIWEVVTTPSGTSCTCIRPRDMLVGDNPNGANIWVLEGTENANTGWSCTTDVVITDAGTELVDFSQYDVVADLSVARGGTGISTIAANSLLYASASDTLAALATVNNGVLSANGSGVPSVSTTLPTGLTIGGVSTFSLDDTASAFNLALVSTSATALTADRTLTFDVNNTARVIDIAGDIVTSDTFTTAGGAGASAITLTATADTTVTLPTTGTLATESYVDSVAQGLDVKLSCRLATIIDLDANASITGAVTYTNTAGAAGRGQIVATLAVSDTFTVDGVSLGAAGNNTRILLKNEATGAGTGDSNGIWTTTVSGTVLTLDRAVDFDQDTEVTAAAFTFIEEGTVNSDSGFVLDTADPITIGGASGDDLTFTQFSGAGQITAGDGLVKDGNTIDADLKANGGVVFESAELAIDLGASAITGTLVVADGGTGAATHTSGNLLEGNGTGAVTASVVAANVVTQAAAGTINLIPTYTGTNKILSASGVAIDGSDNVSGVANLTMTGDLLSTGGLELIDFTHIGSAVNQLNIANAAAGTNPLLGVTGGDANVGLNVQPKGTGTVNVLGTATASAELRLSEDTDNGTAYTGIKAAANVTTLYTMTLPPAVGSIGQTLVATDGAGTLAWGSSNTRRFTITTMQVSVDDNAVVAIAYLPWDFSLYGTPATVTVMAYFTGLADRTATITVNDVDDNIMGTATTSGTGDQILSFSPASNLPSGDDLIKFTVNKSAAAGTNPQMWGLILETT